MKPRLLLVCLLAAIVARPAAGQEQPPDSLLRRAQRLAGEGEGARARALLDSLVTGASPGSHARAEALFWRAALSPDTAAAMTDYSQIVVEYALAPRAPDALLRLGQIEFARGNRPAAGRLFGRLVLEWPQSAVRGEGWYWLGLTRMTLGDAPAACAALDSARRHVTSNRVELLNQVSYASQQCRAIVAAAPSRDSAKAEPDSTKARPDSAAAVETALREGQRAWSAQAGAFRTQGEAERRARAIAARGFDTRVDHPTALFHVRVGTFLRRADAAAMVAKLKAAQIDAIVVEVTRRER
jgi:hypothetical protein